MAQVISLIPRRDCHLVWDHRALAACDGIKNELLPVIKKEVKCASALHQIKKISELKAPPQSRARRSYASVTFNLLYASGASARMAANVPPQGLVLIFRVGRWIHGAAPRQSAARLCPCKAESEAGDIEPDSAEETNGSASAAICGRVQSFLLSARVWSPFLVPAFARGVREAARHL